LEAKLVEANRKDFNKKKNQLIKQWEEETGQKWPTFVNTKGKIQEYDAHHIIENKVGGKNEWWNITPAKGGKRDLGNEHQSGIHRKGAPAEILFGR